MTITLTPELQKALVEAACLRNTTPEQLALDTLSAQFASNGEHAEEPVVEDTSTGTLYDLLAGRIGLIQGSGEAFSRNCGQRFTEYVVQKHQK